MTTPPRSDPARETAARLLDIIEDDILPLTEKGVAAGDKVFGAAVLRGGDLSLVNAATNQEHSGGCPMWHGEMAALRDYYQLRKRPPEAECLLLSTHEPCPMCAAAAAWCGMEKIYFLFDYQDTEAQFAIPHDIRILRQLFAPATALNRRNDFFTAIPIRSLDADSSRLAHIQQRYDRLSAAYQAGKESNRILLK